MKKLISFLILFNTVIFCQPQKENIIIGADRLLSEFLPLLKNKTLGIITNQSGVLSNGTHIVDTLNSLPDVKIAALFGPEHGVRGDNPAGIKVDNSIDQKTGIPVFSLYGKNNKPTPEMLKEINLLIYDIQDVGARFYTYISTLFYALQAAAENNIPIIVLDRPNPINGISVEGPVRKENLKSFVGIAPIPIRYGMTIGELAKMFAGEELIGKNLKPDLTVIKLENWNRNSYYDDLNIKWIKPSPNIPEVNAAITYPGMCLIEGTNISEGRGTYSPFLTIGAPFINSEELINYLNQNNIEGVQLKPVQFTPVNIEGMASNPKYKDEPCNGININITDRNKFNSVGFGIKLIYSLRKLYPEKFKFREKGFDRLVGDENIRKQFEGNKKPEEIINSWEKELNDFIKIRKKYLLY